MSFASLICFKLDTHVFCRELSRAFIHPGTAIANRMPIISTTIMISTRVKARCLINTPRFKFFHFPGLTEYIFAGLGPNLQGLRLIAQLGSAKAGRAVRSGLRLRLQP